MPRAATHIAARALLIAGVLALVVLAYSAQGRVLGYTFGQESGFNLTIDSSATYNGASVSSATWSLKNLAPGVDKFFNFADLKPGDSGENTISLHVNQDAWACLDFSNLQSKENGINEPESHADTTALGELAQGLEFFAWRDDGDNVYEVGEVPLFGVLPASVALDEMTYTLADSASAVPLVASSTAYLGIMWCAGKLAVDTTTGNTSCNGATLGNEAQTDSMSVDISFRAVTTDNTDFRCEDPQDGGGEGQGLGEEIGLFVKCDLIASYGWPLPSYETECPGGFDSSSTPSSDSGSSSGGERSRDTRIR